MSSKKLVFHRKEIQPPPRNSQGRHIGCICIIPNCSSERPNLRFSRSKITDLIEAIKCLKINGPSHKAPEINPGQACAEHIQEASLPFDHRYWSTNFRLLLIRHLIMRVLDDPQRVIETNKHPLEGQHKILQKTP